MSCPHWTHHIPINCHSWEPCQFESSAAPKKKSALRLSHGIKASHPNRFAIDLEWDRYKSKPELHSTWLIDPHAETFACVSQPSAVARMRTMVPSSSLGGPWTPCIAVHPCAAALVPNWRNQHKSGWTEPCGWFGKSPMDAAVIWTCLYTSSPAGQWETSNWREGQGPIPTKASGS